MDTGHTGVYGDYGFDTLEGRFRKPIVRFIFFGDLLWILGPLCLGIPPLSELVCGLKGSKEVFGRLSRLGFQTPGQGFRI